MVTHRGTGQNDVTVHQAAEPAGLPGSQTTLWSFSFTEATTPPKLTKQKQCLGAMTAPHARLRSKQSGLTIPSSAASEASPLQRVVRRFLRCPSTLRTRTSNKPRIRVLGDFCRSQPGPAGFLERRDRRLDAT